MYSVVSSIKGQQLPHSHNIQDLQFEGKKFGRLMSCWGSRLEGRDRKESGASEDSTRTQDTVVKSLSGRWLPLPEEYEDSLDKVRSQPAADCWIFFSFILNLSGLKNKKS